jgi:hypothetical protein
VVAPGLAGTDAASGRRFALAALGRAAGAAVLAGWMPLGLSVATVFLFGMLSAADHRLDVLKATLASEPLVGVFSPAVRALPQPFLCVVSEVERSLFLVSE